MPRRPGVTRRRDGADFIDEVNGVRVDGSELGGNDTFHECTVDAVMTHAVVGRDVGARDDTTVAAIDRLDTPAEAVGAMAVE